MSAQVIQACPSNDASQLLLVLGLEDARTRPRPADPLAGLTAEDRAVFERLRAWRNAEAVRLGLAPYRVLSNRALVSVALTRPRDLTTLPTLKGIGDAQASLHGPALLEALLRIESSEAENSDTRRHDAAA